MPLDLIFFAVIALLLGWRLYSVLGRRTGTERRFDPFARKDESTRPEATRGEPKRIEEVDAPAPATVRPDRERRQIEATVASATEAAQRGLQEIRAADPKFDPVEFLSGAKIAFDMILQAFAHGDLKALRPLLNDQVYANFATAIEERQRQGRKLETTLIGILSAEIDAAQLQGSEARVTVKFTSQQVDVTKDRDGRIVEGDPNEVATIVDLWTFARSVKSRDPNWALVATASPQ